MLVSDERRCGTGEAPDDSGIGTADLRFGGRVSKLPRRCRGVSSTSLDDNVAIVSWLRDRGRVCVCVLRLNSAEQELEKNRT